MQRMVWSGFVLGLFVLCFNQLVVASEADELRERAKAMRKEAEHLQRESAELLEAAKRMSPKAKEHRERDDHPDFYDAQFQFLERDDHPGSNTEVRQIKQQFLKERLRDLLAQEQQIKDRFAGPQHDKMLDTVRQQIAEVERELDQVRSRHAEPMERPEIRAQIEKLEIAGRRIHQMRVAAEHLKAAEQHDLAHEVMKKAEAMERDVHAAKKRMAAEIHEAQGRREYQMPNIVRELREEIEQLRAEVRELSERIERRR
jgi:hypothetical protein